ncbi:DUF6660 family protein [Dyadobacter pollutisoli]|uniref:DUF6660 family protein n=1 Tax=Dyadobacter pollutisoli TaxID=2910158 RepID=UPI0035B67B54
MRIILIILAFYTIALSCIPCQDQALEVSYSDHVTVDASSQQQSTDIDLCSPFCICTCCSAITLQAETAPPPMMASFPVFEELIFAYSSNINGGDLTSIWQPPRI